MSATKSFSGETSDRYARAIFELAKENSELDAVEKKLLIFMSVYDSNIELKNFIQDPTQTLVSQNNVINKLADIMSFSITLKNFFLILVKNRRLFFIKKIIMSFLKISTMKRGKITAELISSKDLSPEEFKAISSELSKSIGSEIKFNFKTDKELIGGFKIQLGSLMIDTSIKNRLKKYEQIMVEN